MGFFGVVGRILSGKQPFETNGEGQSVAVPVPETAPKSGFILQGSTKEIPQLHLGRIENHMQGGRYELFVDVLNASPDQVFIDKIMLLGTQKELDSELTPGQTRQYKVYEGRPLTNHTSGYAQLQYRKQRDGDYFMAYYEVRSRRETDGFFKVFEFRQVGPIKDI